jgi:exopolyphosphatase/guanosine-5'-triphosphate,3'-diphosphate pyrophosphatase
MVRLGSSGGDMKRLEADAIDRGVAVLGRFCVIAQNLDAPITAVATSAVREAANADVLLRRARAEAGVDIEVISGFEEARLIHLGVAQALPVFGRRHLVVDIGGGSTELVVSDGRTDELVRSLKLGAIRLTRRFFDSTSTDDAEVEACRRHVAAELASLPRRARSLEVEVAAGASGTIESVVAMVVAARGEGQPRSLNGVEITRKEVRRVVKHLASAGTVDARKAIEGLDPKRADIVLAGSIILEEVMDAFGLRALVYSEFALREGVLLDAIERLRGSARHHLHDLRRQSVLHLAALCDDDPEHSAQVARLALEIFDGVSGELGLDETHRELLEAAALLCNVGLFVSHAQHHKHSYYVIRNSEHLLGFTDHEIEIVAQVARYHRKSAPKSDHAEFARLDPGDQRVVRELAGILRVALALDRAHAGAVEHVGIALSSDAVSIEVVPVPGADPELERWTAGERKGLLEDVLGRPVRIASA